jgi:hypothetical protein
MRTFTRLVTHVFDEVPTRLIVCTISNVENLET